MASIVKNTKDEANAIWSFVLGNVKSAPTPVFKLKMNNELPHSSGLCSTERSRKILVLAIKNAIHRYSSSITMDDFIRIYSEVQLPEDQESEMSNQRGKAYKMKKLTKGFRKPSGTKTSSGNAKSQANELKSIKRSGRSQCLRIVGRLDIKGPNVVKGIKMEGLRSMGVPTNVAKTYFNQGVDEILYIDLVASLYERNGAILFLEQCVKEGVHVPICVGGGIRTIDDISKCLRAGADKVAINTAAIKNPNFITEASKRFGCQCIVGSIECIRTENVLGNRNGGGLWEAYHDCGRERSFKNAVTWAKELEKLGCGELLVTSIDRDGTKQGLDLELCKSIVESVSIPVICSGGVGSTQDILALETECCASGVACASLFLYSDETAITVKKKLNDQAVFIRDNIIPTPISIKGNQAKCVIVIDYGLGNLYSIVQAVESLGHRAAVVTSGDQLLEETSTTAILPGVGAFPDGMQGLISRGFNTSIKTFVDNGGKLLSICLGAQMLLTSGNEFSKLQGLNIVTGSVDKLTGSKMKIPNVGWNKIYMPKKCPIFSDIDEGSQVYFNHSYYFNLESLDNDNVQAVCEYSGFRFCAAFANKRGNVFGVQFHPEKSGPVGMRILQNFLLL